MIDGAIEELVPLVGVTAACAAVGRPRATHYRWHRKSPAPARTERVPAPQPRALDDVERKEVLRVLHEPDHVDEAPAAVYAKLLDEGRDLSGVDVNNVPDPTRTRRGIGASPPSNASASGQPELVASGLNAVWSCDITKLLGPQKWTWFHLYVIIDIYPRYVPGWMLARAERVHLAERLLTDTITEQGVERGSLAIHADRGAAMASKPVSLLLGDLGVTRTHSRPHVSNDNPHSESQFKTMK